MSMAADRAYLTVSCLTTMLKQDETVGSKPRAKIASAAGKPQNCVLTTMRKVTIAAMITILFVGAVIARAGMKTYPLRVGSYMPIQSLERVW
jgi:hypothetical protein